jgi:O-antigen/teichoic acid export membrane protein
MVARVLGPEGKGALLLLAGLTAALSAFLGFGIGTGAAFVIKKDHTRALDVVATCATIALLGTVATALVFALASDWFLALLVGSAPDASARQLWIWLVVIGLLPVLIAPVADSVFLVTGELNRYVARIVGSGLLAAALTWIFLLVLGWQVTGVLLAQTVAAFVPVALLAHWIGATTRRLPRVTWNAARDVVRVGGQQYALSLVAMVAKRVDAFLVVGILGVTQAGYLSVAETILAIMVEVPRAALWPVVRRLAEVGAGERRAALTSLTRAQLGITLPIVLAGAAVAPFLITFFYGERFAPATAAALAMMPAAIVAPVIVSINGYFISLGRPGLAIVPAMVATVLHVAVSLILMPRFGIVANALGFSIGQILVAAMLLGIVQRREGIRIREMIVPSGQDWKEMLRLGREAIRRHDRK